MPAANGPPTGIRALAADANYPNIKLADLSVQTTLHRIDPELVNKEITSVGFNLAKESDLLKHAADDHKKCSHEVDRGKSAQFVFILQKS